MLDAAGRIRVLLLADSHLGFDLPVHPRVGRRRRGNDFQANHDRALAAVHSAGADLVVHGGDLFHRSRVLPSLAYQAFRGLLEVAASGVPVFLVPGNHERSRIPHLPLAAHPNLHVFQRPGTMMLQVRGRRVALAGFPYHRRGIREEFPRILEATGWDREEAELRMLCMHHCVEGATVGPGNHTFRKAPDVIRCADLPRGFAAILSGHIHRHQRLDSDPEGRPLPTPVLYPGSVERTAFAEVGEEKGFLLLDFEGGAPGGTLVRHAFVGLPARPMVVADLHPPEAGEARWTADRLHARLSAEVAAVPADAVLRIRIHGSVSGEERSVLSAPRLRHLTPPEMNLEVVVVQDRGSRRPERASRGPARSARRGGDAAPARLQMELPLFDFSVPS